MHTTQHPRIWNSAQTRNATDLDLNAQHSNLRRHYLCPRWRPHCADSSTPTRQVPPRPRSRFLHAHVAGSSSTPTWQVPPRPRGRFLHAHAAGSSTRRKLSSVPLLPVLIPLECLLAGTCALGSYLPPYYLSPFNTPSISPFLT